MEKVNDQRFDVEAQHAANVIAIYKAATGRGEASWCREPAAEQTKWERAAMAVAQLHQARESEARATLAAIGAVAACFGDDWPDVPGEPEILRRVKWAARQLQAARALPAGMEPVGEIQASSELGVAPYASIWPWLQPGTKLYTAAQVQAMLAAAKVDMGIPVEIIRHERVLQPAPSLRSPECWCECCDTVANSGFRSRMSICPKCGDKRCPRAYHHNSDCSAP